MELSELTEKKEHEIEKSNRLAKSFTDKEKVSIRNFYPDLKLNGVYGHYIFGRPVYSLVPFMDKVIVNIPPYKTKSKLEDKTGLDIETLIELIDLGRVSVNIDSDPLLYEKLDFLDPLLEISPCSQIRNAAFMTSITNSFSKRVEESTNLFSGKLGAFSKKVGWDGYVNKAANEIENTGINILSQIGSLGYENTYNIIMSKGQRDPVTAYLWAFYYSTFLADPVFDSIDGIVPVDRNMLTREKNRLPGLPDNSEIRDGRILSFPTDVGRMILSNLRINLPKNLDTALDVKSEDLRKLLLEVDRRMEHKNGLNFEEMKEEAERAVNEVMNATEPLTSTLSRLTGSRFNEVVELSMGVTGLAAAALTHNPLFLELGALGGFSIAAAKVPELIAEQIVKFKKPSHVIVLLGLKKKLATAK